MANKKRILTKEEILKIASNFKRISHFKEADRTAYKRAAENGWLEEIRSLMDTGVYNFIWTKEAVAEEAKKYNYRAEFYVNNPSAYGAAKKYKILNEVCAHMIYMSGMSMGQSAVSEYVKSLGFSVIDNFNIQKTEFDIYIPLLNKAIEFDGTYWHNNNPNDLRKDKKAIDLGIVLLRIDELKWNKERENCLKQICLFLNVNFVCNEKFLKKYVKTKVSVGFSKDELFEIAKQFDSKKDLQKKRNDIYKRLWRRGLLDEACNHMQVQVDKDWSLEKALQIARSCKTCKEMQKKSSHAYRLFLDYGYDKTFFKVLL